LRAPPTPHGGEADKLDPFREVRSPARNFGPARLAGGVAVTPLARRLASEAGIDLTKVTGSGPRGRIVARDLDAAPKPLTQAQAALPVTLTADVMIGQPLALCAEASGVELSDIVVKAWGATLARAMPGKSSDIALLTASGRRVIRDAASKPLSVLAKLRADGTPATGSENAASAISIPGVPGIASVADILRPPHTTLLSVAAPRRAPVEGEDGSVRFTDMMTVTLACDPQAGDAAGAAQLLAAFKAYVERPVMMLV
jgi:pyruvate dehydrogenase E2 component (dihydrolipoamide acetyltransferase)